MISKRIDSRRDGKSSARAALAYGEGLKIDKESGEFIDKSHRSRFGNFGLVDDGVYIGKSPSEMGRVIHRASIEMQANCDRNTRVGVDKKIAHFVVSFNQEKPSEAVLVDTEDTMLSALGLDANHFATFLHNDNGHWHLHIFASRIEKGEPHRGNPLWQDRTKRDKVCREIELRHGLTRDNGMHTVNDLGEIVEVAKSERKLRRESKPQGVSDKARTSEIYSGEKSFQSWCNEIRIGDRLKHAKSWADLHAKASVYGCVIKQKGAGFVVCPKGKPGAIQLSKVGLKNLQALFGAYEPAQPSQQANAVALYEPEPTQVGGTNHYAKWKSMKAAFNPSRVERINAQRAAHAQIRKELRAEQKAELANIAKLPSGRDRFLAISVTKMRHAVAQENCKLLLAAERQALRDQLASESPGNTFRDYLVTQANLGDNQALGMVRRYAEQQTPSVARKREADKLQITAALHGNSYLPTPRMEFSHHVQSNGSIVYDFGGGRQVTDSAISRQVMLNTEAANSPQAIATALTFATSKFGSTLTLTGSPEFQRLAVETSVRNRMGIKFVDPDLESLRIQLERQSLFTSGATHTVDFSHLTHQQIRKGAEYVLNQVPEPPDHILRSQSHTREQEANRAGRVHELSGRNLDDDGRNVDVLLPDFVQDNLGDIATRTDQDVRHTGAGQDSGGTGGVTGAEEKAAQERRGSALNLFADSIARDGISKPLREAGGVEWEHHTGTVIAVADGRVAIEERDAVTIHALESLRIESDGNSQGLDALVPGNKVDVLYKPDRAGKVSAKAMITEQRDTHQNSKKKGLGR